MEAWRKGSGPEVGREPVEGTAAQPHLRPEARAWGAPGPQGLGSTLATLALPPCSVSPGIGRPRHWRLWWKLTGLAGCRGAGVAVAQVALAPAPSPEDPGGPGVCGLLSGPGPSPSPAAEGGPGSLGWAACSAVGLTGPLCAETEAPFTGATGPAPVEKEHRLLRKGKSISLSPQVGAGDPGGSRGPGPGRRLLGGAFLGKGRAGSGRLPAL